MSSSTQKKTKRRSKSNAPLTKEAIVTAALKIIDRDGTEAFSMRNLAVELKVFPTAIYWHIANRNALIGEVIASVLVDLVPDDFENDWQKGILGLCRNYRTRIQAHPNIAPLIGVQLVSNSSLDFQMIERLLVALEKAGFKGHMLKAAYNTVISAMVGYTTQEFSMIPSDGGDAWATSMKEAIRAVDKDLYPTTAENLDLLENNAFIMRWDNGITSPLDEGFELSINSIVKGLALSLEDGSI